MTNPKERLEEILNNLCYNTMGEPPYRIDLAITEILKEFVYKDNLPNYLDIMEKVNYHIFSRNSKEYKDKIKLAKAIRKLIEGKK